MNAKPRAEFPFFRLLVISGAVFASVSSEFLPTGILPQIAKELRVSESQVGLLVSVFAFTVALSAVPLAALTRALSRKWLMAVLLVGFAVTNFICAAAQDYWVLAGARVLGGLCHGLFWSVTGPYASHLVKPKQLTRALSITNAGGTLAFILGVPIGTAIGVAVGWRAAFGVMGGVVLLFALLVVLYLPPVDHRVPLRTGEIALPAHRDRSLPGVLAVCGVVLLVALGQNSFNTYIAPWLLGPGGATGEQLSALLFVAGLAGAVGLALVSAVGDRRPTATLTAVLVLVAASVLLLMAGAGHGLVVLGIVLFVWAASFGGWPALMQARMLHTASPRIRDLASASLTMAFNLAIGGGALLGGAVLDRLGVATVPWVELVFVVAALPVVLLVLRRRARPVAA